MLDWPCMDEVHAVESQTSIIQTPYLIVQLA